MPVTPEYNLSTSAAIKNTLDYFLEEYYFKPSAIVSYLPGFFGGINAAQQLRLVFVVGYPVLTVTSYACFNLWYALWLYLQARLYENIKS